MSEMIFTQPSPEFPRDNALEATPATEQPEAKRSRYQERIDQLVARNADALRKLEETQQRAMEMEARLRNLETTRSEPTVKPKDWSELSDNDLYSLVETNGHESAVLVRVVKELARREAETKAKELEGKYMEAQRDNTSRTEAYNQILGTFGPDAFKDGTPLREKAREIAVAYEKKFGGQALQPYVQYLIFAEAKRQLGESQPSAPSEALRARQLDRERVEAPVSEAITASASLKSLLTGNDPGRIRKAIRQLDFVRGVAGEGPKDTGSPS